MRQNSMVILSEETLHHDARLFVVEKDYSLDGRKIVLPPGMKVEFNGGSINNGTIVMNDVLLDGVAPHSINAQVEGTVANKAIKMSWFADINKVKLTYTNQVVYYDEGGTINTPVEITGSNVIYEGMNNNFICNSTFFVIRGASNITIQNFYASAVASEICFEDMPSYASDISGINISNNHITGFKVGISLNNDTENHTVSDCVVSGNYIENCSGASPGHGYGIHLAHAVDCIISNNTIINSDRHSIYHAYGSGNKILNNTILNHRMTVASDLSLRSAIEISRRSVGLTVKGNTITNCYNAGILVYAFPHSFESDAVDFTEKYGCCENITIDGNTFVMTGVSIDTGLPSIMLGYLYNGDNTSYTDFVNYYVKDVKVINNTFIKASTENLKCIRVDQCRQLTVQSNSFQFNAPATGHEKNLIEISPAFKNVETMTAVVKNNNFSALSNITNYGVYCLGELLSIRNTLFDVTFQGNTFTNQKNGSVWNFRTYKPVGITTQVSSNLHLQSEPT